MTDSELTQYYLAIYPDPFTAASKMQDAAVAYDKAGMHGSAEQMRHCATELEAR